jgi:hypothetical protein
MTLWSWIPDPDPGARKWKFKIAVDTVFSNLITKRFVVDPDSHYRSGFNDFVDPNPD